MNNREEALSLLPKQPGSGGYLNPDEEALRTATVYALLDIADAIRESKPENPLQNAMLTGIIAKNRKS